MSETTLVMQHALDRLRSGDEAAADELIEVASARLLVHARRMFQGFPSLKQWEETGDIAQTTVIRLQNALKSSIPDSPAGFFGMAAQHIRWVLLDLKRRHFGRNSGDESAAAPARVVHANAASDPEQSTVPGIDVADDTNDPSRLAAWCEFHEYVETMSEDLRSVVELLWYHELTQVEAAEILDVDEKTIRTRWRKARLQLHDVMEDWLVPA